METTPLKFDANFIQLPFGKTQWSHNVQRRGLWNEASIYMDKLRHEAKRQGATKLDAAEWAWMHAMGKWPIVDDVKPEDDPKVELLDTWDSKSTREGFDIHDDVIWVYENFAKEGVGPEDAPGPGAWALLVWARKNPGIFFGQMLQKAMTGVAKRAEMEAKERLQRDASAATKRKAASSEDEDEDEDESSDDDAAMEALYNMGLKRKRE